MPPFSLPLHSPTTIPLFSLPISTSRRPFPPSSSFTRNSTPHFKPTIQPQQQHQQNYDDDDEHILGDCLVFDESAFDLPFPDPPNHPNNPPPKQPPPEQDLIPEKWKPILSELTLTKKEKRKISHDLKFGSKMVGRRKKSPLPDMEQYQTYRDLKLSQLHPVVLDEPEVFVEKEEEIETVKSGRVVARNPRVGLDGKGIEDLREFFNSGRYVPGGTDDNDKKPQGLRKLFTMGEKVLLNRRIPNLADATSSKWLPLHTLAASGEFYLLDMLLKHNVDINAVDKDGLSAIHKAIIAKKQAIINYLLRNSANPFVCDRDGATLIHYAVQAASSHTIKILLLYNVDINLADNDGWTPLHLAVQTQRTDIVRLLLIKGADRALRNRDGLTPLDLCLYSGHDVRTYELIKLLKGLPMSMSAP